MKITEIIQQRFDATDIKKKINIALGGKAKVMHLPFGEPNPNIWWIVVMFNNKHMNNILNKLEIIKKTHNIDMEISNNLDELLTDDLTSSMLDYTRFNQYKQQNPDATAIVILVRPNEEESEYTDEFYHVSYQDRSTTGLGLNSTRKYKDRIYLFTDIDWAKYFAHNSFHRTKETAYLYKVIPAGKIFKDHEEQDDVAVYTKTPIPSENLTLISKFKVGF